MQLDKKKKKLRGIILFFPLSKNVKNVCLSHRCVCLSHVCVSVPYVCVSVPCVCVCPICNFYSSYNFYTSHPRRASKRPPKAAYLRVILVRLSKHKRLLHFSINWVRLVARKCILKVKHNYYTSTGLIKLHLKAGTRTLTPKLLIIENSKW